jgi:hypothetical protein
VGLTISSPMISTSTGKKYRSRSSTPRRSEERDSAEGTMGVKLTHSISIEKKYGCRTYTPKIWLQDLYPPAGRKRDSDGRTMGWSQAS